MTRYALVIGIPEYKSQYLPALPKTTTDAEAVAQLLKNYGDFEEITRLPRIWKADKDAYEMAAKGVNRTELDEALKRFLKQAKNNEALIYFTGHGISVLNEADDSVGYLATSDCRIEKKGNQYTDVGSAYSLQGFNQLINKAELSSLLVILDCCHSGNLLEQAIKETFTTINKRINHILIAACRGFEEAYVGKEHSVFTGALLEGLSPDRAGEDGSIDNHSLFSFISNKLRQTGQQPQNVSQGGLFQILTKLTPIKRVISIPFNSKNPYLGLKSFEAKQTEYFGGREEAIAELTLRLNNSRFLTIIGASGCGKSSLVKAGLLPRCSEWITDTINPGKNPVTELKNSLDKLQRINKPFVLFIDQFEEIFTQCNDDDQRKDFFRLIEKETKTGLGRIVIAIRGDFLDRCAEYTEIAKLVNASQPSTYMVQPLSLEELVEAITKAAKLHGVDFDYGLVRKMAQDVFKQSGALPLLQYALWALWIECIEKLESPEPLLTWRGYEQVGEVGGALEKRADGIYDSFTSDDDKQLVRKLFIELVELGDGETVTRRRVAKEDLEAIAYSKEQFQRISNALQDERLIVVTTRKEENFKPYIEVTHEALLTKWGLLRNWITENRENIRLERRFEALLQEWKEKYKKSEDALLTGAKLTDILDWKENTKPRLSTEKDEFIKKSKEKRDRDFKKKLDDEKNKKRMAIAAGCLATVALGFGLLAQHNQYQVQQKEAEVKQQETINAEQLIYKAEQLLEDHNQFGALTASVEALSKLKEIKLEEPTYIKRVQTVISHIQERNRFQEHSKPVYAVSFSPNGEMLASAGADKTIIFDNFKGLTKPITFKEDQEIWRIRFSSNGQFIALANTDGSLTILQNLNRRFIHLHPRILAHKKWVYDLSFSKDSKHNQLASSSTDGYIKLLDVDKGNILRTLRDKKTLNESNYEVYGIDFSPTNKSILVATGDKNCDLRVWDLNKNTDDQSDCIGKNPTATTSSVRFNREGTLIASADTEGWIKLWKITNKKVTFLDKFQSHKDGINSLEFSLDGKFFASSSLDQSIKVWSINNVLKRQIKAVATLQGHIGSIYNLSFNPNNSQIIASASADKTVRVWTIDKDSSIFTANKVDKLIKKSCELLRQSKITRVSAYSNAYNSCTKF